MASEAAGGWLALAAGLRGVVWVAVACRVMALGSVWTRVSGRWGVGEDGVPCSGVCKSLSACPLAVPLPLRVVSVTRECAGFSLVCTGSPDSVDGLFVGRMVSAGSPVGDMMTPYICLRALGVGCAVLPSVVAPKPGRSASAGAVARCTCLDCSALGGWGLKSPRCRTHA